MNNLFICSTRFLKLKEINFDLNLGYTKFSDKDELIIDTFRNQNITLKLGINHLPEIGHTPYFYDEIDDKLSFEVRSRNSEKKLEYFEMIVSNLWFIKDCSCNVREYIDISVNKNHCTNRRRNMLYSNSKGEYTEQTFTIEEFKKSVEITNIISKIKNDKISEELIKRENRKEIIAPSDFNYFRYYDTNRIERAMTFLTIAKSNSFLPLKISFFIGLLETLFTTDNSEVSHKVAERIAFYLQDIYEKKNTFKVIKECYGIRSKFVHGQHLDKKYNHNKLTEVSSEIDIIIRKLLNKVVLNDSEIFLKNQTELNTYFNNLIFK